MSSYASLVCTSHMVISRQNSSCPSQLELKANHRTVLKKMPRQASKVTKHVRLVGPNFNVGLISYPPLLPPLMGRVTSAYTYTRAQSTASRRIKLDWIYVM